MTSTAIIYTYHKFISVLFFSSCNVVNDFPFYVPTYIHIAGDFIDTSTHFSMLDICTFERILLFRRACKDLLEIRQVNWPALSHISWNFSKTTDYSLFELLYSTLKILMHTFRKIDAGNSKNKTNQINCYNN